MVTLWKNGCGETRDEKRKNEKRDLSPSPPPSFFFSFRLPVRGTGSPQERDS
jgi:hypothetical protein